jgi:hypothetical protein
MDWITIAIIVGIVVVLIAAQLLTGAGSQANNGMFACMMPKSANAAKGAKQKSERSLADEAEKTQKE